MLGHVIAPLHLKLQPFARVLAAFFAAADRPAAPLVLAAFLAAADLELDVRLAALFLACFDNAVFDAAL
jgi:hypothetical protein